MKLSYADRVLETTTTQGTGPITLLGATVGCQSFIEGVGTGAKVCYTIEDGQNWEVGTGIVTSGASDTLSRDVVLESSANGSPVNWGPGTRNVFLSASSHVLTWLKDDGTLNDDDVVGTTNIKNEAVTPAKMKKMPTLTIMGNKTGADGAPQYLTPSEVNAMLNNNGIAGQCLFVYATNATCKLIPHKGNKVTFPSGAVATIPAAGITTTITAVSLDGVSTPTKALAAGTAYFAYLWNKGTAGTPEYVIDWSTTGHSTDANTGIEIKTGDATRVLVGWAEPEAGPLFAYGPTKRLVASWFNRRAVSLSAALAANVAIPSVNSGSPTLAIPGAVTLLTFFTWGDSASQINFSGSGVVSGALTMIAMIAVDGNVVAGTRTAITISTNSWSGSLSCSTSVTPAEGKRTAEIFASKADSASTGSIQSGSGISCTVMQ